VGHFYEAAHWAIGHLQGPEIERPLTMGMTGGLVTLTLFTLLACPRFTCSCTTWGTDSASAHRCTARRIRE
jgi:hypothetical protein